MITALSLPFLAKKTDLPPIVSVELIQITDKTNIPFAQAKKTIEKIKEKKKISIRASTSKKSKKIKPDSVPMPDDKVKKLKKLKKINKIQKN